MTTKDFVFKLIDEFNNNSYYTPCEVGLPCIYKEENRANGWYCASGNCYEGLKVTFKQMLEKEEDA